jgi:hypothetical protein
MMSIMLPKRDLDERDFGGILGRTPERWFLPTAL